MKKFFLALSAVVIFSSISFAYTEDDARDALIVYSGTEAFTYLTSEERSACMAWVADGGYMNELCRSAVTKLISDAPNAVSPEHRKALLAAASGRTEEEPAPARSPSRARKPEYEPALRPSGGETVIKEKDNTGAVIAAGVVGVIAGMVIHNNLPKEKTETVYYPVPDRRPPHHRPAPAPHRPPHRDRGPRRH